MAKPHVKNSFTCIRACRLAALVGNIKNDLQHQHKDAKEIIRLHPHRTLHLQVTTSMLRRHPLLVAVGLLLVAAATALAFAIATFDLNNYRSMLSDRLSQKLDVPVSLGEARFALHQGINLDFSNVRIGGESSDYDLHAEHLFLRLKLRPLLQRQIAFSAIEILSPTVRIHSSPATKAPENTSAPISIIALLHETKVKFLTIRDGQFHWQRQGDTQKSEAVPPPLACQYRPDTRRHRP